ncbi:MAG: putative sulfate exporter family transporter [Chloroflexota bacterium]
MATQAASASSDSFSKFQDSVSRLGPGLGLVALLSGAALVMAQIEVALLGRPWIEGLVIALLLGILVRNTVGGLARFEAGAAYAGKQVLEFAVMLLGAGISFQALFATGPSLASLIVIGVCTVMLLGFGVGRAMGLPWRLSLLVATGNAICGNSAIAAMAPVIKAERRDVAAAIALTAVIGVVLVIALPLLIPLMGLSYFQYGVVAGMGVYAVPQVLAAAFPLDGASGGVTTEVATLTKLGRVVLLGPLVLAVGLIVARAGEGAGEARRGWSTYLPWFLCGFLILAVLRSVGLLPAGLAQPSRDVGGYLTVLAMAGLGLGVKLSAVREVGPRVAVTVVISLLVLLALTLTLIRLFGISG